MLSKTLRSAVIQLLEDEFSALDFKIDPKSDCFVTIQPAWRDFGLVEIYEEHGELIVNWGQFTHSHIDSHNEDLNEQIHEIVDGLHHLLGSVVADKVAFWGQAHDGAGGFFFVNNRELLHGRQQAHLWSSAAVWCSTNTKELGDGAHGQKTIPLEGVDVECMHAELGKRWLKPDASSKTKPWWRFW